MSRHPDGANVEFAPPRALRLIYLAAVCGVFLVAMAFVVGAEPEFWLLGILVLPGSALAYVLGGGQQGAVPIGGWILYVAAAIALFRVRGRVGFWILFGASVALMTLDAAACHQQLVLKHLL